MPILARAIAGMCRPSLATTLLAMRTEIGARFDFGRALGLIEALKLVLTGADFDVDRLRGGERGRREQRRARDCNRHPELSPAHPLQGSDAFPPRDGA